ncbi:ABC transporter permease [Pseudoruegeria sp. HB172150]|uniref:ABC transporter permease n=1 Tax=Pseudoruegeria sp. HB172150 TaxID=2721164 RepID=UPI001553526B|nr:ABC transporter permease [Pseudoruegeria sp. HB172150]
MEDRAKTPTRFLLGATVPESALPWLGTLAAIALVDLAVRIGMLPAAFFPPPSVMFVTLGALLGTASFWHGLWDTLWTWAASLGAAAVLGIALGVGMGASRYLYASLRLVVEFLRPIPSVALIPAVILVIGVDFGSKIFLAAFAAFWPILIQTIYGMHDVEPQAMDTARAYGMPGRDRLLRVALPSASPYVGTGIRIGSAVALIIVVTMEIVVGIPGLGELILQARQGANVERTYALILAAGLLGMSLNLGFARLEARLLFWHPSHRKDTR